MISDRLGALLAQHAYLYGIICRDATLIDIELMAQTGYHVVWLDREHSAQPTAEMLRLCRTVEHLGMVPMMRVSELARTPIQTALDGGIRLLALPNVGSAEEAARLVQFGKYPPTGQRGVSTTNAGAGYTLGNDLRATLAAVNAATHLMVMIESETGYRHLDAILAVEGIDMLTIGPLDWATSLGVYGEEARSCLLPKIERVLTTAARAGVTTAMFAADAELGKRYRDWGVRIFFLDEDVVMKRKSLETAIGMYREAMEG
jgi:2-keto-3-deoxy-L-rhamnonate aldolase RhmA